MNTKLPNDHLGNQDRECIDCKQFKKSEEFPLHKHTPSYGGYVSLPRCKNCQKNYKRKAHLLRKYGLSEDNYNELLIKQKFVCAICGCGPDDNTLRGKKFVVDHCHKTGKVRGILCYPCNVGIGMFQENPKLLEKVTSYLHTKDI